MKDIPELKRLFAEYLTILNRAPRTISELLRRLERFITFLKVYNVNEIHDITKEHMTEYQKYLHYRQNRFNRTDAVSEQNHHIVSVKCFFRWLKQEGYIANDPAEEIVYGKEPKQLPKTVLNNEEVKRILKQPDTGTSEGYRNRTILEVLYSSGIRKSELVNLKIGDVDYEQGFIRVNKGKGNKDRVVPLGKIASHYVENYLKGIRPWLNKNKDNGELFLSLKGNKFGSGTLDAIIKKYVRQSKIEKPVSAHTFRRTCATEMIKNRANVMHIKDMLGHNSMQSIQAYCNLSIVDLKEAHKKYHPRERDEK